MLRPGATSFRCLSTLIPQFLLGLSLPPMILMATHALGGAPLASSHARVAVDVVPLAGCVGQTDPRAGVASCLEGGVGGPSPKDLLDDTWPSVQEADVLPQRLFAPNAALLETLLKGPPVAMAGRAAQVPKLHPVREARVTSHYGPRHDPFGRGRAFHGGIDFAAPLGTPIRSAAAGVVIKAQRQGGYGNVIKIDHGNGHTTLYAHNQKLLVRSGQMVMAGQPIALLGSTGRSTGPHLHFEVRVGGQRVDPKPFLPKG